MSLTSAAVVDRAAIVALARALCSAAGLEPDSLIASAETALATTAHMARAARRQAPAWTTFFDDARATLTAAAEDAARTDAERAYAIIHAQPAAYADAPFTARGVHDAQTLAQMDECLRTGRVVAGALCADGHIGYAQPVGGVVAYDGQISISGVGSDIGCGNLAVRLDTRHVDVADRLPMIAQDIARAISFGLGRRQESRVEHPLFDDLAAWDAADLRQYRPLAMDQLGTVGSGNHYVDVFVDEDGFLWIGVHFGSRGLGHTAGQRYLTAAGGRDAVHVRPTLVDAASELGVRYHAAMTLAGAYAIAGREWVVERVRHIIGGTVTDTVHNFHNFAWHETHGGRDLWVVRKGATPAWPGQRGFVGGSMGDDAVILEGVDSASARALLRSTVHGAGRVMSRNAALARFTLLDMQTWLDARSVTLIGGGVDESPMNYRRLPDVLTHHADAIVVRHTLRPLIVVMAGAADIDPYKD